RTVRAAQGCAALLRHGGASAAVRNGLPAIHRDRRTCFHRVRQHRAVDARSDRRGPWSADRIHGHVRATERRRAWRAGAGSAVYRYRAGLPANGVTVPAGGVRSAVVDGGAVGACTDSRVSGFPETLARARRRARAWAADEV